ncbi:MAG TPA: hemerythrin domain-containing protein [Anaeromyxobacter sp.]|nr:hemerythrin domain-containing protein [Anaeromyxobacter sp.]
MDAVETLMNEHRTIERVLDALVGFAEDAVRRGATEKAELGRFVTFVREFADACHHGKEEDILFAAMVEAGFPRNGGPIAVMLHEHDQGRALVGILKARAEQPAPWSDEDRHEIAEVARGFSAMLHAHIHKEDAILYPMAEQHLPPERMERVGADCERYEAERLGSHERLHALAEALVARHAPAVHPPSPSPHGHRFGCSG